MKSNLLFLFMLCSQMLAAQLFTEASPTPFFGFYFGEASFADLDGDNDNDMLLTGQSVAVANTILYFNDGQGNFTAKTAIPIAKVSRSSMSFSDVDGDGDNDILIAGLNNLDELLTRLYLNDGQGNFTEKTGTSFEGVRSGSISFSDVDGDNDDDVLLTGRNSLVEPIAKLYLNDGQGNFTEKTGTAFEGIRSSSVSFSDVDGDSDNDVLLTGRDSQNEPIAKLYTNDGQGNFTEVAGTPFTGVASSSISFSDIDGDNDDDVLITGKDNLDTPIAKLYTNDGLGSFTEVTSMPFVGVESGSVAFSDVDGDDDNDVIITGLPLALMFEPIAKLYINDGQGAFTEMIGEPFDNVALSSVSFSDVDSDGDNDVLIMGLDSLGVTTAKLFTNTSIVSSVKETPNELDFDFVLFPNPTRANQIAIEIRSKESKAVAVKVFDLNGRLVSQQQERVNTGASTFSIDISSLSSGKYILQIADGEKQGSQSFLIQ